jgi:hypothetical protein
MARIFRVIFRVSFPALPIDRIERFVTHRHGNPLPNLSEDYVLDERGARNGALIQRLDVKEALARIGVRVGQG